jgi:glucosylceramidase
LNKAKKSLISLLKQIKAIQPGIKLMATPWSPPAWMKDNLATKGGSLAPAFEAVYAQYLVKYIQAMQQEGLPIWALTPQNEPLHPGNNPSLLMTAGQQNNWIKNHLGPAFVRAKLKTKIIIYDHNCDKPEYPIEILNDPETRKYVDGSAFHLYNGDISALNTVKKAHPDKALYFTEQWTGSKGDFAGDYMWHIKNVIIGAMNNHSKTALEWNLANDENFEPVTPGGCTECKGALTISKQGIITRNQAYYIIGQASKIIPTGSIRIDLQGLPTGLNGTAAKRPDGKIAVILQNETNKVINTNLNLNGKHATVDVPEEGVISILLDARRQTNY